MYTALPTLFLYLVSASPASARGPIRLEPPPVKASSALLWVHDTKLVVPDPRLAQIHIFGLDGKRISAVGAHPEGNLELRKPFLVTRHGDRLLLLDGAWHLLELGEGLEALKQWRLPGDRHSAVGVLSLRGDRGPVLDLPATDLVRYGDSFLLQADMKDASGWRTGVVEITPEVSDRARLLVEVTPEEDRWYLYRVNLLKSLAATSRGAFVLRLDRTPRLEQILPVRRSVTLPEALRNNLALLPTSQFGGAQGFPLLHAKLRTMPLPFAIHAFRDQLYLLSWQPQGGTLRWELWRLREDDRWQGPLVLPVPAETRDIIAAPGESTWALVLKGKLLGEEAQQELLGFQVLTLKDLEPLQ